MLGVADSDLNYFQPKLEALTFFLEKTGVQGTDNNDLIGKQFFRIRHAHPVSVLGFLWLEAFPPRREGIEQLIEVTGLPRAGFRQLLVHSVVDVRHRDELRDIVDALPLEPWHEELIGLSALQTMAFLVDAWMDIVGADVEAAIA